MKRSESCQPDVADRVEPAIDRVEALVLGRPGGTQPALLGLGDGNEAAHRRLLEIKLGQALEGLDDREADMVDVAQLLGHGEQRAQHDAYGLARAVALVDHLVGQRIDTQALANSQQRGVGDVMRCAPDPSFERGAGEAQGFGGAQHGG
jgi:hypothetical protein